MHFKWFLSGEKSASLGVEPDALLQLTDNHYQVCALELMLSKSNCGMALTVESYWQ